MTLPIDMPGLPTAGKPPAKPKAPHPLGVLYAEGRTDDDEATDKRARKAAAARSPAAPKQHEVEDYWRRSDAAIRSVETAVRHGLGQDVVRDALDLAARDLARYVDRGAEEDLPNLATDWRRRLRRVVNADASQIDKAELVRIRGDVAAHHARRASNREATGIAISRDKESNFVLKDADGQRLLSLSSLTGSRVLGAPADFAPQMRLLRRAVGDATPEELHAHALAVFSSIHERDHNYVDARVIYEPTKERAKALVSSALALRAAETPSARAEAEALLKATLFAEAAPGARLASFGLDVFTPLGRANAAKEADENLTQAIEAFSDGRLGDGAASTFWTAVDAIAVVGGIRFGKILEMVARTTPPGRRIIAARKLARMESTGRETLPPVDAEAMLGKRMWARYDENSQKYLQGLLRAAKGAVGEEAMRKYMADLKANPARGPGKQESPGRQLTRADIQKRHGGGHGKNELGPRFYDEVLTDTAVRRVFGIFLWPASTPGLKTRVEHKMDSAYSTGKQSKKDKVIAENLDEYDTHDLLLLRTPYNDISKLKLRSQALAWMRNKDGMGAKYVQGVDKFKTVDGKKVFVKRIKWSEEHLDRMIKDVDRTLALRAAHGSLPTVADFLSGLAARMAVAADKQAESKNEN